VRARTLIVPGVEHRRLERHLFPGDGKEAAAILICTRVVGAGLKVLVRESLLVPHHECQRERDGLTWPGHYLDIALDRAETDDLSLVLMHSHPGGFDRFSERDDDSDRETMPSLFMARSRELEHTPTWHGSAVMLPSGAVRARLYDHRYHADPVNLVAVYGDDLRFFWDDTPLTSSRPMAFSDMMTAELAKLSAAVIGCSGTGSIVAEQLLRMGFGHIVVVDDDRIEHKNLNRILNSTHKSAEAKALKVDRFRRAASKIRPATLVTDVPHELGVIESILAAADTDIVFCCVDTETGRHLSDRLATAMLQPLFDIGVSIPVRKPLGRTVIANVCGRVDYVQPGGPTLLERDVYSPAGLEAEALRKTDPEEYAARVKEGYMPGAPEQAPSVICVNMRAAATAVQEFVARAYPYRLDGNMGFSRTEFDLATGEETRCGDEAFERQELGWLAKGLQRPLLGLPSLEDQR
jgi:hypothetical protein